MALHKIFQGISLFPEFLEVVLLVIHPIIQFTAALLALYVLYLGVQRFRFLHLHQKTIFKWKLHVVLGEISLGVWLAGMLTGFVMVYIHWHGVLITGTHGKTALVMLPFIIFGLLSGLYMNRKKRKRRLLPAIHALNNLFVLILASIQVTSGWPFLRALILAG